MLAVRCTLKIGPSDPRHSSYISKKVLICEKTCQKRFENEPRCIQCFAAGLISAEPPQKCPFLL